MVDAFGGGGVGVGVGAVEFEGVHDAGLAVALAGGVLQIKGNSKQRKGGGLDDYLTTWAFHENTGRLARGIFRLEGAQNSRAISHMAVGIAACRSS